MLQVFVSSQVKRSQSKNVQKEVVFIFACRNLTRTNTSLFGLINRKRLGLGALETSGTLPATESKCLVYHEVMATDAAKYKLNRACEGCG